MFYSSITKKDVNILYFHERKKHWKDEAASMFLSVNQCVVIGDSLTKSLTNAIGDLKLQQRKACVFAMVYIFLFSATIYGINLLAGKTRSVWKS